jgi:hypothetical protein
MQKLNLRILFQLRRGRAVMLFGVLLGLRFAFDPLRGF